MLGPNVRHLIAMKMAKDAIPPDGGFEDGVDYLLAPELGTKARDAAEWVRQAIAAVRSAPDNPFGDDDEAIAGALLKKIEPGKRRREVR